MIPIELIAMIGGPFLSILTALVVVQMWALKKAKQEGITEEQDKKIMADVEAAHRRIREEIMPELEALKTARAEDSVRMENLASVQIEMKDDIKTVLSVVQGLAIKIAEAGTPSARRNKTA